jgi:hypothetical protein
LPQQQQHTTHRLQRHALWLRQLMLNSQFSLQKRLLLLQWIQRLLLRLLQCLVAAAAAARLCLLLR